MRYAIVLVPLIILFALACDEEDGGAVAPTATAELEATATDEATSATVVFLRGTDLWVAPLDDEGAVSPRQVTSGSLGAGYAGFVQGINGGVDVYYVSQLTEPTETDEGRVAEFGLYRVGLEGGEPEELLRFTGRASGGFPPSSPSVSPDGEHIMYADLEGLTLLDLSSGQSTRLLENGTCEVPPDPIEACWTYADSQWAPAGDVVQVRKVLYEGAVNVLVRPFESPVGVTEASAAFGGAHWSPDGERLCTSEGFGLDDAEIVVIQIATGEVTDILANLPTRLGPESEAPDAYGCAWSQDGRLAIGYSADIEGPGRIGILDADFSIAEESGAIENLDDVVAWLPDGSGVVFNRRNRQAESFQAGLLPAAVFDLELGTVDLPFQADLVLGVIP